LVKRWGEWLRKWFKLLEEGDKKELAAKMKKVSPKYVPREWMLIEAYKTAEKDDYTLLKELYNLFLKPYDEQSPEMEEKYFRKAPLCTVQGQGAAGQCFMT